MNIDWGTVLGTGFGGAVLYGLLEIVKAFFSKRQTDANAASTLSKSAMELIEASRADAEYSIKQARDELREAKEELRVAQEEARREVTQLRAEAAEARREATEARRSAEESLYVVQRLTRAIRNPYATVEALREMVSGLNGTHGA